MTFETRRYYTSTKNKLCQTYAKRGYSKEKNKTLHRSIFVISEKVFGRMEKNKISAIIYSWTEKLSVARVKVFFAFKHVTAAAMFKPCVRKRDILARFPQLSLDFSTPLHTNNNRTHYIRSTYACVAFVTKHRNTSKRFQEVEKCVGISHAFSFPFSFFFLIPRLYPNDKNKKRERFGRRRIR